MLRNQIRIVRRATSVMGAAVLVATLIGCGGKDNRPNYAAPDLAASEAAILKADNGFWISEVDGAKIDQPGVTLVVQPGNTVKVAPGDRKIKVTTLSNSYLVNVGGGGSSGFTKFSFPFRAGHTYKLGGPGAFKKGIKVTDTETKTEAIVGG